MKKRGRRKNNLLAFLQKKNNSSRGIARGQLRRNKRNILSSSSEILLPTYTFISNRPSLHFPTSSTLLVSFKLPFLSRPTIPPPPPPGVRPGISVVFKDSKREGTRYNDGCNRGRKYNSSLQLYIYIYYTRCIRPRCSAPSSMF